jgi:hypothetical protein
MRFPSVTTLLAQAREVSLRFPWTMAVGVFTAFAAIMASRHGASQDWLRVVAVAGLGLPLTVALTLLAEERHWAAQKSVALNLGGLALLVLFYKVWPDMGRKHEAIRYSQLSAGLHLLVAVLPFAGQQETNGFWQYNRRLFLGFLRAILFSEVLFLGLAIALVAVDKLFGVHVPSELYLRLYFVIMFVVNTAIFLAAVPLGLRELAGDTTYPRVLKVFAQYILTPLVFTYLIILLAYLIKIVLGGEWPSGWIGWLVSSVAIAGLLGFLLVHPLRHERGEGWIRSYTRLLFVGLIPAALVLLVAFWKRILPYGLTEPRLLGILLGIWLLVIAVSYTIRQDSGIRRIPVSLAALLLLTVYGPLSVTRLSVASQGRRLRALLGAHSQGQRNDEQASAALRFLLDHAASREIAAASSVPLPAINWDSLPEHASRRDEAATRILSAAGMRYVPEYRSSGERYFYLNAHARAPVPISGYDWMVRVSSRDTSPIPAGVDSVRVRFDSSSQVARFRVGSDTFSFDLQRLPIAAESTRSRYDVPPELLRLEMVSARRRARLALETVTGERTSGGRRINEWHGTLLLGKVE